MVRLLTGWALPDEVIAMIFETIIMAWEDDPEHDFMSLGITLKCVTSICRTWRDIALRTPRLWCNMYNADLGEIDWHPPADDWMEETPVLELGSVSVLHEPAEAAAAYIHWKTCLRRSGPSTPLRIYAEKPGGLCDLLEEVAESNGCSRICYIELRDNYRPLPEFEDKFDFDKLDYLHCSNLRSLSVTGQGGSLFVDLFDMLSWHPGIEILSLRNIWWSWSDMQARELPLTMPNLREFKIFHHQQTAFNKTFLMLKMPNLERLAVETTYVERNSIPSMSAINLDQTFPSLKEFVTAGALMPTDIVRLLEVSPNIDTIQLRSGVYEYEDLFEQMERHPDAESALCVKLKHLIIQRVSASPRAIRNMVESRHMDFPLTSIMSSVEDWDLWPEEILARLETFVGLRDWIPTHLADPWAFAA